MITGNSEKLPVIDHLSYSSVNTYRQCPLKWHFRYIERLPEEVLGSALVFGSAVHSGIERHFQTLLETGNAPTTEELLEAFDECWTSFDSGLIKFGKGDNAQTMRELAEKMFTTFQASHFANPKGTIVAVEESMRAEFVTGVPDVLARVDLAVQSGDELVLTDFKTSRSRWSANQAQSQAEQLLLYADLAGRVLDGKQIKLQFAVVTKAKTPVIEVHEVEFDETKLNRTKRVFEKAWSAIQDGHFYPAPSPMNCFSCGYKTACQAWNG